MKRIINGQILKPIIIACCCLCIARINCDNTDNNLHVKRSLLVANRLEPRGDISEASKLSTSLNDSHSLNSESKISNVPGNQTRNQTVSTNNPSDKIPGTERLTSKTTDSNNSTKVNHDKDVNTKKPGISSNNQPSVDTGALLRGASVFLGLSIVVIAYIIFRCARLNKNRTQMVRKYGILAHRQDVEMRPLPLNDEDDDDTTVFDASEITAVHDKQRRTT